MRGKRYTVDVEVILIPKHAEQFNLNLCYKEKIHIVRNTYKNHYIFSQYRLKFPSFSAVWFHGKNYDVVNITDTRIIIRPKVKK